MKTYSRIFILFLFLGALLIVGCNQDNIGALYSDGGKPQVAFSSTVLLKSMTPADNNEIQVAVYRTSNKGTTPQVKLNFVPSGISIGKFTLKTPTLSFVDGSNVAYAVIGYTDINALKATAKYAMTLQIIDTTDWSPSNMNVIAITAQRQLTFEPFGTGTFTSTFFGGTWNQPILKAQEGDVYRLPALYPKDDYMNPAVGYDFTFAVNPDNTISFDPQQTGYVDATYGMITINQSTTIASTLSGKTVTLGGKFTVALGSFGNFKETLLLP